MILLIKRGVGVTIVTKRWSNCAGNWGSVTSIGFNFDFYRLQGRYGESIAMAKLIYERVTEGDADFIFTHNPVGKYGHGEHMLVYT
jgi:hypothetical protein